MDKKNSKNGPFFNSLSSQYTIPKKSWPASKSSLILILTNIQIQISSHSIPYFVKSSLYILTEIRNYINTQFLE